MSIGHNRAPWPFSDLATIGRVGRGRAAHCVWYDENVTLCGKAAGTITEFDWQPSYMLLGDACEACVTKWRRLVCASGPEVRS